VVGPPKVDINVDGWLLLLQHFLSGLAIEERALLLIEEPTTINAERLPCDKMGLLGSEEGNQRCDVVW